MGPSWKRRAVHSLHRSKTDDARCHVLFQEESVVNITVTLDDVNDSDKKLKLSESEAGNVVIEIDAYGRNEVIIKPDDLLRTARLFATKGADDDR